MPPAAPPVHGRRMPISPRLLVLLFVVLLPAVTTRIYASDEAQYFSYLRSLWFDGDVSFENEYQHFYDAGIAASQGFHETFLERTTETGRRINFGTIGCALLWAPFYAVADGAAHVARAMGRHVSVDGYSKPYVIAVSYASALYGLLALLTSVAIVRRLSRWWPGLGDVGPLSALIVWLGTPLLFYMYIAPPMSHATSAFAVAAFVLAWLIVRDAWSIGGMIVLGALAALMAMVREQDAFFVAGPAVDFAWSLSASAGRNRWRRLVAAAAGAAAFAVTFLPQALAYLALNGRIGPSHLVARKMYWYSPHALQVVGSPSHGFLMWTPLAAVACVGLVILLRRLPAEARMVGVAFVVMAALQVYIAGSVDSWTVAGAFGQRRFVALTSVLVVGVAAVTAAAREIRWQRVALGIVLAAAVWWNIALIVQFGAGMMDRQRLEPSRIAYNTFIVVPRALPGLAWRYLTDRASFYESARSLGAY
jgi:hypothetical protein